MFLLAVVVAALVSVPLTGGSLRNLRDLRLRAAGLLAVALLAQVLVISVLPNASPGLLAAVHVLTYAVALAFVALNLRLRGMWIVGVGGLLNFAAIAANGGVMPASASALRSAGQRVGGEKFVNSGTVRGARLSFLGDVFAIPSSWPLHNVFSLGDVLIATGIAVVIHHACHATQPRADRPPAALGTAPGSVDS